MNKKLLSAAEIKSNAKPRKLIKEFMESDEEVPEKVLDYMRDMMGSVRLLAPVDISDEDMENGLPRPAGRPSRSL